MSKRITKIPTKSKQHLCPLLCKTPHSAFFTTSSQMTSSHDDRGLKHLLEEIRDTPSSFTRINRFRLFLRNRTFSNNILITQSRTPTTGSSLLPRAKHTAFLASRRTCRSITYSTCSCRRNTSGRTHSTRRHILSALGEFRTDGCFFGF